MPKVKAPHHKGTFPRESARVRAAAYLDPMTRCWRCGLTLEEKRRTKPRDKWTAGHVIAGAVDGPLLPEHASCNYSHGAAMGNKRRGRYRPQPPPVTELTW